MYNTLAEQWDSFAKRVFYDDTPAIQIKEMRRAFYSGAIAVLLMQNDLADPAKKMTDESLVAILEGWHYECDQFLADVQSGKA